MASHDSYPLNSENASPPGTFRAYLSTAARTTPARASNTAMIDSFFFIVHLLFQNSEFVRTPSAELPSSPNRRQLFYRHPKGGRRGNAPIGNTREASCWTPPFRKYRSRRRSAVLRCSGPTLIVSCVRAPHTRRPS